VEDEDALAPLKKGVKDGKLGSLNVYPKSLKIVKEVEEPRKEDKKRIPFPLVIGFSCGGVFVLTLLAIFLVRYCQQRNVENRNFGDGMPAEVAFPRPDKYELQGMELKEACLLHEKSGLPGEPATTQELGIQNAAADDS